MAYERLWHPDPSDVVVLRQLAVFRQRALRVKYSLPQLPVPGALAYHAVSRASLDSVTH